MAMAAPSDARPIDRSTNASQSPLTMSYPRVPVTPDGSDPFSALPAARQCSTNAGGRPRSTYPRLSRYPQRRANNPLVRGDRATVAVEYSNRRQQRFTLYVSGSTFANVRRYMSETRVCLEAFELKTQMPTIVEPVAFDQALVDATTDATGLSRSALSAVRASLGSQASLLDVLAVRDVAPEPVLDAASDAAKTALDAKVAAGLLPASEVVGLDVRSTMQQLAALADPPFLFADTAPATPAAWARVVRTRARRNIVVSIVADPKLESPSIVWWVIDPTIYKGHNHGYRSKTYTSARMQEYTKSGTVRPKFWRLNTPTIFNSNVSAAAGTSGPQSHSSAPSKRTYDLNVHGVAKKSKYTVTGGWVG